MQISGKCPPSLKTNGAWVKGPSRAAPPPQGGLPPTPRRFPRVVLRRCEPASLRGKCSEAELRALPALPAGAERRASVPKRSYASGSFDFEGNEILVLIFILFSLPAGVLPLELAPWRGATNAAGPRMLPAPHRCPNKDRIEK